MNTRDCRTRHPLPDKNRLGLLGANNGLCCCAGDVSGEILIAKFKALENNPNILSRRKTNAAHNFGQQDDINVISIIRTAAWFAAPCFKICDVPLPHGSARDPGYFRLVHMKND